MVMCAVKIGETNTGALCGRTHPLMVQHKEINMTDKSNRLEPGSDKFISGSGEQQAPSQDKEQPKPLRIKDPGPKEVTNYQRAIDVLPKLCDDHDPRIKLEAAKELIRLHEADRSLVAGKTTPVPAATMHAGGPES